MKFELQSFGTSILRILNIATGKYLAMDSKGMLQTRVRLRFCMLYFSFLTSLLVLKLFCSLTFYFFTSPLFSQVFPWKDSRPPKKVQNVSETSSKKAPLIQNSKKFVKTPKNSQKKSSNILYTIMPVFFGILTVLSLYIKSH